MVRAKEPGAWVALVPVYCFIAFICVLLGTVYLATG
jgi:hypothetical protein